MTTAVDGSFLVNGTDIQHHRMQVQAVRAEKEKGMGQVVGYQIGRE
jgi:hypothetical protein